MTSILAGGTDVLIALVALLHGYFLVLEMFLWDTPYGRRAFGLSEEKAKVTKVLAANQGLYNGFLAAGLILALIRGLPGPGVELASFILACVIVAGLYGASTAARRILYVQALPAILALAAVLTGV